MVSGCVEINVLFSFALSAHEPETGVHEGSPDKAQSTAGDLNPCRLDLRQGLFGAARLTLCEGRRRCALTFLHLLRRLGRTRVLTESPTDIQKSLSARLASTHARTPSGIIRRCAPHPLRGPPSLRSGVPSPAAQARSNEGSHREPY